MPVMHRSLVSVLALSFLFGESLALADGPTKQECVAANESAQNLKRTRKLLEARSLLLTCVAKACPGPVREDCLDLLNEVQNALPTIVFAVQDANGKDIPAVSVTVDGAPLADQLDGSPIEVDPGVHSFSFESEGFKWAIQTIRVNERDRARRVRVLLQPLTRPEPAPAAKPEITPPPATAATSEPRQPPAPAPPTTPRTPGHVTADPRTWPKLPAYVALGVGGSGIAVGSLFGVAALNRKSSLDGACKNKACPPSSRPDIGALHADAVTSNVSLGIGIAGLAVGGVLLFLSRNGTGAEGSSAPKDALLVIPSVGLDGVGIQGTFR
jgi:hypothetical protein